MLEIRVDIYKKKIPFILSTVIWKHIPGDYFYQLMFLPLKQLSPSSAKSKPRAHPVQTGIKSTKVGSTKAALGEVQITATR